MQIMWLYFVVTTATIILIMTLKRKPVLDRQDKLIIVGVSNLMSIFVTTGFILGTIIFKF